MTRYIVAKLLSIDTSNGLKSSKSEFTIVILQKACSVESKHPFHLWQFGHILTGFSKGVFKIGDGFRHG